MKYNLLNPIFSSEGKAMWRLEHAVQGLQIFGGIGSGKTSGSGSFIARKYLSAGFGGLVLTVKKDELANWQAYCVKCGRSDDLVVVEPQGGNTFNFLDYEANREGVGSGLTENIVKTLKTVIRAGQMSEQRQSDDAFWDNALDLHLFNIIDLCLLGFGRLTIDDLYDLYQSTPKTIENLTSEAWRKGNVFLTAFMSARQKYDKGKLNDDQKRLLQKIDSYFFGEYLNLHEKTRSIIEYSLGGLLFRLTRDPIYSLFCNSQSTFVPEDCIRDGKIILINLPVKEYDKVGKDGQILFKYIWQRAMERRDVLSDGGRPTFLWADEAQNFIHEHDIDYQATARSSRVCTVYLTQNLPNYNAQIGGNKGEWLVKSFLGTMATKIFHANADYDTNKYAADLIGQEKVIKRSKSRTAGSQVSSSASIQEEWEYSQRPESFISLKSGGSRNKYTVEGIMHRQGSPWPHRDGEENKNHIMMDFIQDHL